MTYQEEKLLLKKDLDEKFKALEKEEREAMKENKVHGLDSEFALKRKNLVREQNRRLEELKEKYSIK